MVRRYFEKRCEVKRAKETRRRVRHLLKTHKDLLPTASLEELRESADSLKTRLDANDSAEEIRSNAATLQTLADQLCPPPKRPGLRDNIEVVLVAAVAALAFRTFFFQPFKIPTGSMQPTLYGIEARDYRNRPVKEPFPKGVGAHLAKLFLYGEQYFHETAGTSGRLRILDAYPKITAPFLTRQRFLIGRELHTLWNPPPLIFRRLGLENGDWFEKGQEVVKLKVSAGDHLLANRFLYNFCRPKRGDIVVFRTALIDDLPPDHHYIKRLIGLSGETVRIGDDRHVYIDGRRLGARDRGFERIYDFSGPPRANRYSGHVNQWNAWLERPGPPLAPLFQDELSQFRIGAGRYFVLGDNTMNSEDSRQWGDFPRENVIGKASFIYWPISKRWAWNF